MRNELRELLEKALEIYMCDLSDVYEDDMTEYKTLLPYLENGWGSEQTLDVLKAMSPQALLEFATQYLLPEVLVKSGMVETYDEAGKITDEASTAIKYEDDE